MGVLRVQPQITHDSLQIKDTLEALGVGKRLHSHAEPCLVRLIRVLQAELRPRVCWNKTEAAFQRTGVHLNENGTIFETKLADGYVRER